MGAMINCGIGWRTAISMWRWRNFTGMPTGVELVDFYQECMVLIIANSL